MAGFFRDFRADARPRDRARGVILVRDPSGSGDVRKGWNFLPLSALH
jgi:hypothetical protein